MRVCPFVLPALMAGVLSFPLPAGAQGGGPAVEVFESRDPALRLGEVAFEGGRTLDLSVGIGSGAFRRADEPGNEFWTVSDRGPNFACGDAEGITGISGDQFCAGVERGRIYPFPGYSPTIYRIRAEDGAFSVVSQFPLRTAGGKPLTGLLNPLTVASTETPVDAGGRVLAHDVDAVDAEGIVRLADGGFWIGDENGPSILEVDAEGRIRRRLVPAGTEKDYAGADYAVEGALPAILARRTLNRGIESMAVSSDDRFLYFVLQNPLANPDDAAYRKARNTRLFKYDREAGRLAGEYVYELTPMAEFHGEEKKAQSTARVSELLYLAEEKLLLLDRTEKTTKLFEVDLAGATDILGSRWDDPATLPSLEQVSLAEAGIRPVAKALRFDTADHPDVPVKAEGLARFADGALMMINDDDFGIEGARTRVVRITGLRLPR